MKCSLHGLIPFLSLFCQLANLPTLKTRLSSNYSHSQSYFTTGGLSPISSSWRQAPWDPQQVFFFNTCGYSPYVTSSLTREWVCRLHLLLVLARAVILGSESRRTHDHILLSQIRDTPQPGGPGPRIYISQEQGGPVTSPGTGFPFRRLLRLAGLRWRYSNLPPHGVNMIQSIYSLGVGPQKTPLLLLLHVDSLLQRCVYRTVA
jgi:hypothetical protein